MLYDGKEKNTNLDALVTFWTRYPFSCLDSSDSNLHLYLYLFSNSDSSLTHLSL